MNEQKWKRNMCKFHKTFCNFILKIFTFSFLLWLILWLALPTYFTLKPLAYSKEISIITLTGFMEIQRMASVESISAHMRPPQGVIRAIWTEFPRTHRACWHTIDFKSCFRAARLDKGAAYCHCGDTNLLQQWSREGDQMWPSSNHSLSSRLNDLCNAKLGAGIVMNSQDTRNPIFR